MSQVLNFFDKWSRSAASARSKAADTAIQQQPKLLTLEFVGDMFAEEATAQTQDSFSSVSVVGRAGACVSSHNLVSHECLPETPSSQSSQLSYLQQDARQVNASEQDSPLFKKRPAKPRQKIRGTALLDASELIEIRSVGLDAYSNQRPETAVGKDVSLEVLRKLRSNDGEDDRLDRVRKICEKVSAEALINSPSRRPQTAPLRHSIKIKIG